MSAEKFILPASFQIDSVVGAFIWIGPAEELFKVLGPILVIVMVPRWRAEPFEWMLACAASGVGFAMSEDILYAVGDPGPFQVLFFRSLAPMHLSWSALIGYSMGCRDRGAKGWVKAALASWALASLLHGSYDAVCFIGEGRLVLLLMGVYVFGFVWRIRRMSWLCASRSPRKPDIISEWPSAVASESSSLSCIPCDRPLYSVTLLDCTLCFCSCCGRASLGRQDLFELVSVYSGTRGWFKAGQWHEFYWVDSSGTRPCVTCNETAPTRAFLDKQGPEVAFCDGCMLGTAPRQVMAQIVQDYRDRIRSGFKVKGDLTDI
jgi:hypothetical protein